MEPQPDSVISVSTYFNHICRLCLKQAKLESLKNSQNNVSSKVLNLIEALLNFKLPEKICEQCLNSLTKITVFLNKCKHSQKILKQIEEECDKVKPTDELKVDILDHLGYTNEPPVDCVSNDNNVEILVPDHLGYIKQDRLDEPQAKAETSICQTEIWDHLDYIKKEPEEAPVSVEEKKRKKKRIPRDENVLKICDKCGKAVATMRDHYKKSRSCCPRNFKCNECGLFLKSTYDLEIHRRVRHLNETYMCHICSQMFRYEYNLRRHLEAHENPRQFVCEMCGKAYTTKCHLEEHINSHTGEKPFRCSYCDKSFRIRSSRFVHEQRHLKMMDPKPKIDNLPQTCDICNKVFSNKRCLKVHKESHGENRIYKCLMCGKEFPSRLLLSRHSVIHKDERRHPCTYCGKRFRQRESLVVHLRTHTGERPFPCTLCPKKFMQKTHLSYHMLLHKGDKSFGCQFCGRMFTLKGNLTVHLRIHTGERPYQCHVCQQGFCDSSSRKRHVVSKHGIEEVKSIRDVEVINNEM